MHRNRTDRNREAEENRPGQPKAREQAGTPFEGPEDSRLGAEVDPEGVRFRVWSPLSSRIEVLLEAPDGEPRAFALDRDDHGWHEGVVRGASAGDLYRFRLDGEKIHPDPRSRFQPSGVHGPSRVVDPRAFEWSDAKWGGVSLEGQVLYEVHIGTFTPEGTFAAATAELPYLRDLGVTLIELMPVGEFPGRWNWGYDGVLPYAVTRNYGEPDDFRRFVDAAHRHGIGVIVDVVYNHLGPEGNCLPEYSDRYLHPEKETDWGRALNFDGPGCEPVRRYFIDNARYWIREYHLDGLRLDATQDIHDSRLPHILGEIALAARREAGTRRLVILAENEPQDLRCLRGPEDGGFGCDGLWNDDFHHDAIVGLGGRRQAYYTDYRGRAQEFISLYKRGFLYQGQRYKWQDKPRGTRVTREPASAFVNYLQNHDQIANSIGGMRPDAAADPARLRVLIALLLLAPQTPLLFMGQEYGATTPFLYFADNRDDLSPLVHRGRKRFLAQFPSYATEASQERIPDPSDPASFLSSKLDRRQRETNGAVLDLHRDLLRLRRSDPVLSRQDRFGLDGAVLDYGAFCIRYFGCDLRTGEPVSPGAGDRLLLVNLGTDLEFDPAPEPLLAPPPGGWEVLWSSDEPRYGGVGTVLPVDPAGRWQVSGAGAYLLAPPEALPDSPTPRPDRIAAR